MRGINSLFTRVLATPYACFRGQYQRIVPFIDLPFPPLLDCDFLEGRELMIHVMSDIFIQQTFIGYLLYAKH